MLLARKKNLLYNLYIFIYIYELKNGLAEIWALTLLLYQFDKGVTCRC